MTIIGKSAFRMRTVSRQELKLEEGWDLINKAIQRLEEALDAAVNPQKIKSCRWKIQKYIRYYTIVYNIQSGKTITTANCHRPIQQPSPLPQQYRFIPVTSGWSGELYNRCLTKLQTHVHAKLGPRLKGWKEKFALEKYSVDELFRNRRRLFSMHACIWLQYNLLSTEISRIFSPLQHYWSCQNLPSISEMAEILVRDLALESKELIMKYYSCVREWYMLKVIFKNVSMEDVGIELQSFGYLDPYLNKKDDKDPISKAKCGSINAKLGPIMEHLLKESMGYDRGRPIRFADNIWMEQDKFANCLEGYFKTDRNK